MEKIRGRKTIKVALLSLAALAFIVCAALVFNTGVTEALPDPLDPLAYDDGLPGSGYSYNQKIDFDGNYVFDSSSNPVMEHVWYVSNWAEFVAAWNINTPANDPQGLGRGCDKIVMLNHCIQSGNADPYHFTTSFSGGSGSTGLTTRTRSIEINGQGYVLNLGQRWLRLRGGGSSAGSNRAQHIANLLADMGLSSPSDYNDCFVRDVILIQHGSQAPGTLLGTETMFIEGNATGGHHSIGPADNGTGGTDNTDVSRASDLHGKWNYTFKNITIPPINNLGAGRHLIKANNSNVDFMGMNDITLVEEVGHVGSIRFRTGSSSIFKRRANTNVSMFWMTSAGRLSVQTTNINNSSYTTQGTSLNIGAHGVTVEDGADCVIYFDPTTGSGASSFPAFYQEPKFVKVGDDARLAVTMRGNAVRFQNNFAYLEVGENSVFSATSTTTGSAAVNFSNAHGCRIEGKPGSEFYIVGRLSDVSGGYTTTGLVDFHSGTGAQGGVTPSATVRQQFIMDSPKAFDLRHAVSNSSGARLVFTGFNNFTDVIIKNSDIDFWNTTNISSQATFSFPEVGIYQLTGAPGTGTSTSQIQPNTDPDLIIVGTRSNNYRRIVGFSQTPEVMWLDETDPDSLLRPVTDADKHLVCRVIRGWVADEVGVDEYGNLGYLPVYATLNPNQPMTVTFFNEDGTVLENGGVQGLNVPMNANGYVYFPTGYNHSVPSSYLPEFWVAGSSITAVASQGARSGEGIATVVLDRRPPEPATPVGGIIAEDTTANFINCERGATVTATLNGQPITTDGTTPWTATVDNVGEFQLELPAYYENLPSSNPFYRPQGFNMGDVVQIFLEDAASNKNPAATQTFLTTAEGWLTDYRPNPEGTKLIVSDYAAKFKLRQIVLNPGDSTLPEAGYATATLQDDWLVNSPAPIGDINSVFASGLDDSTAWTDVWLAPNPDALSVKLQPIIPQYFEYVGYKVSSTPAANEAASLTAAPAIFQQNSSSAELCITIYIQPTDRFTNLHARDWKDNEFGPVRRPIPLSVRASETAVPASQADPDFEIDEFFNGEVRQFTTSASPRTITIYSKVAGDGSSTNDCTWTVTGNNWSSGGSSNNQVASSYTITIPANATTGSIRLTATTLDIVDGKRAAITVTISVTSVVVRHDGARIPNNVVITKKRDTAMDQILSFTSEGDPAMTWNIYLQTGRGASFTPSTGNSANLLIPKNYVGTIYVRVRLGNVELIRFRVNVVR
ncbi:MAG: hypothetical protein FWG82_00825 [Oscillospiraceae bacterium]|nr:hypothetical protein [Oscillospiraceae bacterium]